MAGASVHVKVVETAKSMGLYTIVTDYLQDSPAKKIADEALLFDIYDIDALVEYGKRRGIDGVIDFAIDPAQRPAREISSRLRLPTFCDSEQMLTLTDKKKFKQYCALSGLDVIEEYSEQEARDRSDIYPVLVKPSDSRGSRGVSVCHHREALGASIEVAREFSSTKEIIIEHYCSPNEYQELRIVYIVKNGVPFLVNIGDRYTGYAKDSLDRTMVCAISPSRYTESFLVHVHPKVVKMIERLGIQNGPVFIQGFAKDNKVLFFDPGVRFPGSEFPKLIKWTTGFDAMKSLISFAMGGEIDDCNHTLEDCFTCNGKFIVTYFVMVHSGTIGRISGLEELRRLPFVVDVQQRAMQGDTICDLPHVKHRAVEISISVKHDVQELVHVIEDIQSRVRVEDTCGNDMVIPSFDPQRLFSLYK